MHKYIVVTLRIITTSKLQHQTVSGRKKKGRVRWAETARERSISELSAVAFTLYLESVLLNLEHYPVPAPKGKGPSWQIRV